MSVDDTSHLSAIAGAERAFARRPTTRIVFDTGESATAYTSAVRMLGKVSYLMGELLDSSEETSVGTAAEHARIHRLLARLGSRIDIWEIGNEVNGNWLGPYAQVAAKLFDAYEQVRAAGGRSALTLYANDMAPGDCGDGASELTPAQFSARYVPASVRDGIDFVLLSYYEQECGGVRPSAARWTAQFTALHALYPNARLGFGEIGLTAPVKAQTLAQARSMIRYYYALRPRVAGYAGGGFWWYFAEDAVPATRPLWRALNAAGRSL